MTEMNEIYKCNVCGNIVEVLHEGVGELVCCNQPMILQKENTEDAAQEKHVPVIEETEEGTIVKVGSQPHPMVEEHYIEWIEIILKSGRLVRQYLNPEEEPQAIFKSPKDQIARAREFCNKHGHWSSSD